MRRSVPVRESTEFSSFEEASPRAKPCLLERSCEFRKKTPSVCCILNTQHNPPQERAAHLRPGTTKLQTAPHQRQPSCRLRRTSDNQAADRLLYLLHRRLTTQPATHSLRSTLSCSLTKQHLCSKQPEYFHSPTQPLPSSDNATNGYYLRSFPKEEASTIRRPADSCR